MGWRDGKGGDGRHDRGSKEGEELGREFERAEDGRTVEDDGEEKVTVKRKRSTRNKGELKRKPSWQGSDFKKFLGEKAKEKKKRRSTTTLLEKRIADR